MMISAHIFLVPIIFLSTSRNFYFLFLPTFLLIIINFFFKTDTYPPTQTDTNSYSPTHQLIHPHPPTHTAPITNSYSPTHQLIHPHPPTHTPPPTNSYTPTHQLIHYPYLLPHILLLASSASYTDWGPRGCSPSRGKE